MWKKLFASLISLIVCLAPTGFVIYCITAKIGDPRTVYPVPGILQIIFLIIWMQIFRWIMRKDQFKRWLASLISFIVCITPFGFSSFAFLVWGTELSTTLIYFGPLQIALLIVWEIIQKTIIIGNDSFSFTVRI